MNFLKRIFQKKDTNCCEVKIEEVKEEDKTAKIGTEKSQSCCK